MQHDKLGQNLSGLATSASEEETKFGNIVDSFHKIEQGLGANEFLKVGNSRTFQASGAHARYTGGPVDLTALSVTDQPVAVAKGQMLAVETTGQYSPTCALRETKLFLPVDNAVSEEPIPIDAVGARIGPEGFSVVWTGSNYKAKSATRRQRVRS